MPKPTTSRLYADTFFPTGGVGAFIEQRRNRDKPASWRRIALDLRDATDARVDVTPETVRRWATQSSEVAA